MTSRRTWRRADVVTHLPLTKCIPAPHAWRTGAIMSSGWGSGASDMACADVATAKPKTTAINLIILSSYVKFQEEHFSSMLIW
jgi:hypothetical protein